MKNNPYSIDLLQLMFDASTKEKIKVRNKIYLLG